MASTSSKPTNVHSRKVLKGYFLSGNMPTEQHFASLIDSAVNPMDDGFSLAPEYGLQLAADKEQNRLASFYPTLGDVDANNPAWFVELAPASAEASSLSFSEAQALADAPDAARTGTSRLHLAAGGHVGIGTTDPQQQLDVRGYVASHGRVGTYADDPQNPRTEVPADGQWHPILTNLDGLHAFEIVAAASGAKGRGRYALTHATALSAFGKSNSRIFRKNAWFWGWFQKIQFRWTGELHKYGLEMRTASSFGAGSCIVYHITHLFGDSCPGHGEPLPGQEDQLAPRAQAS
ncbi:MAG TPA: hypothetical protein VF629_07150 [Hymenobacter sp.]|jgi:hypothetical protein|uniref:hypothetical protein n=1 Tax=Hymenobacter sp. TaxID=1898978 RepID=UPI002EDAF5AA